MAGKQDAAKPIKGMILKKAGKGLDLVAQTLKDEGIAAPVAAPAAATPAATASSASSSDKTGAGASSGGGSSHVASGSTGNVNAPVQIIIEEKVSVNLNNDGGLNSMEVKGDLYLKISDAKAAHSKIGLVAGENPGFQFKTHPNINKSEFTDNFVIAPKSGSQAFPVDNNLGVLKWRFVSTDESHVPIAVNCWPSPVGGDKVEVTMEYELKNPRLELHNVLISIPCQGAGSNAPVVESVQSGQYKYDAKKQTMLWRLPLVDGSSATGTLVFVVQGVNDKNLLPLGVTFSSPTTMCDLTVGTVSDLDNNGTTYPARVTTSLVVEKYEIV